MEDRTCVQCRGSFSYSQSRSKYCSKTCANRAKYERIKATGYEFVKRERVKAKYASDPEFREHFRARQVASLRARGEGPKRPMYKDAPTTCSECSTSFFGTQTQIYCGVLCRRRAARKREAQRAGRPVDQPLKAMIRRCGLGDVIVFAVIVRSVGTGGLLVWCPGCGGCMGATSLWTRLCPYCQTTAELNEEEAQWVASEHLRIGQVA